MEGEGGRSGVPKGAVKKPKQLAAPRGMPRRSLPVRKAASQPKVYVDNSDVDEEEEEEDAFVGDEEDTDEDE